MARPNSDTAALLMVGGATVGLALKGIFAKLAFAAGVSVSALVLLRLVLAVPLFWGVAVFQGVGNPRSMSRRDWRDCIAMGGLFLLATVADFTAIDLLGAGLSRVVLFTFPLLVTLINAFRAGAPPSRKHLIAFALSYGGLVIILSPTLASGVAIWQGIVWSLISALSYALYLAFGQDVIQRVGSLKFTLAATSGSALGMMLYGVAFMSLVDLQMGYDGAGWLAAIVVFSTVLPFLLLYEGIARLGAGRASLISLAGPAITVAVAWAVLGETLSMYQGLGFALVLMGIGVLEGLGDRLMRPAAKD